MYDQVAGQGRMTHVASTNLLLYSLIYKDDFTIYRTHII